MIKALLPIILFVGIQFNPLRSNHHSGVIQNDTIYSKAYEHLIKDSNFSNKLKSYYPDLTECSSFKFSHSGHIKPISTKDFPMTLLANSSLLNKQENIEYISPNEQEELFNSIYNFSEYNIQFERFFEEKANCEIRLTFSKKVENILPIKFQILDKEVDPRIVYNPRIGMYILEFNSENEVVNSEYILLSY